MAAPLLRQQAPQMGAPPQAQMGARPRNTTALQALEDAGLVDRTFFRDGFDSLDIQKYANSSYLQNLLYCCGTCGTLCFGYCHLTVVSQGSVRTGTDSDGKPQFLGPGAHAFFEVGYEVGDSHRVSMSPWIFNGTKAIVTVQQGMVGLALKKGMPVILPPGIHQWDDADMNWSQMIDLSQSVISIGPYTLVTVEESYAAITMDNGMQKILSGGASYMLTHQNWKFMAWLSMKMQTNQTGETRMTTGDNIELTVVANVNWVITDAVVAAGKNVDLGQGQAVGDPLSLMRADVLRQVTAAVAVLVGRVSFSNSGETVASEEEGEDFSKLDRRALWDPMRLQTAVDEANSICARYGVEILTINLIIAQPADDELTKKMQQGAVAAVRAAETRVIAEAEAEAALIEAEGDALCAQERARVEEIKAKAVANAITISAQGDADRAAMMADALLVEARAEAEAVKIRARADAKSDQVRAEGEKDAGKLLAESEVATQLAKLTVAYGPFAQNRSSTFYFGLKGGDELPQAIMGSKLAGQRGLAGAVAAGI